MSDTEQLLIQIEAYCKAAGISLSTFGREAGQGGNFCSRLKSGKRSWPETIEKVRRHMAENPPELRANRGAAA